MRRRRRTRLFTWFVWPHNNLDRVIATAITFFIVGCAYAANLYWTPAVQRVSCMVVTIGQLDVIKLTTLFLLDKAHDSYAERELYVSGTAMCQNGSSTDFLVAEKTLDTDGTDDERPTSLMVEAVSKKTFAQMRPMDLITCEFRDFSPFEVILGSRRDKFSSCAPG